MYHVNAQGIDECLINVHYYYYYVYLAVSTGAKGFADPDSAWNGGVFSKQT